MKIFCKRSSALPSCRLGSRVDAKNIVYFDLETQRSFGDVGGFAKTRPDLDRPDMQLMFAPYSLDFSAQTYQFERFPGDCWVRRRRQDLRFRAMLKLSMPLLDRGSPGTTRAAPARWVRTQ